VVDRGVNPVTMLQQILEQVCVRFVKDLLFSHVSFMAHIGRTYAATTQHCRGGTNTTNRRHFRHSPCRARIAPSLCPWPTTPAACLLTLLFWNRVGLSKHARQATRAALLLRDVRDEPERRERCVCCCWQVRVK
jgi:hypothetical protein